MIDPDARVSTRYPTLYEINTRVWLQRLSAEAGRPVTLTDIDDATLDGFARRGFDWIWLLGVWRTGLASRAVSRSDAGWRAEFRETLPDLSDEDIAGSCFAVAAYEVDEALGGAEALAAFRTRLAARGLRLMLDFVGNHTALDHPWTRSHPEYYVAGTEEALAAAPANWCRIDTGRGPRILAHGRDPNYPGWADTLQLDYANSALQAAQVAVLSAIARQCDGVRCDMAMLLLPDVFRRTWGTSAEPFWPKAIAAARQVHPGFAFLAEAYWDLEWTLQQQGFDWCYDKRLYDRLVHEDAGALRAHLAADPAYQDRLARFLENHDEARAAAAFPWPRHRAAAIVAFLSPGLRFFYEGQFEGARVHVPMHLRRGPVEPRDAAVAAFYERLLRVMRGGGFRDGAWSALAPRSAWDGNPTWQDFVACLWRTPDGGWRVVVVNFSDHQAQCRLSLADAGLPDCPFRLVDLMGDEVYERDGHEMREPGLYIDLGAWRYNVFRLDPL
ncbi:alpha-amylase family glycosyl hydrolase [Reyranella sp.]|uniref:alpha-amylase family glycosyl hydrolase n=1 Tax=Reyranella sp. TaxID=1929291 RepID=UPI003BA9D461